MQLGRIENYFAELIEISNDFSERLSDFGPDRIAGKQILKIFDAAVRDVLNATHPLRCFIRSETSYSLRKLWLGEAQFSIKYWHNGYFVVFDKCPTTGKVRFYDCGYEPNFEMATMAIN